LTKNERYALSLQQQTFKNYIVVNIPISDLFRRREDRRTKRPVSRKQEINAMPREGVRGTLFFANEPDRHRSLLEQQTLSKEYQKKMKAILDQPDLRFQVA